MAYDQKNDMLYRKMFVEQANYKAWLLTKPPEEILSHAYEYTVREDILAMMGSKNLTDVRAKALLKSPCPLADVFKDWDKRDNSYHMDDIWDTVVARADTVIARAGKAGPER